MTSKEIIVKNVTSKGDHLPSQLVQLACRFDSSIEDTDRGKTSECQEPDGYSFFPVL